MPLLTSLLTTHLHKSQRELDFNVSLHLSAGAGYTQLIQGDKTG